MPLIARVLSGLLLPLLRWPVRKSASSASSATSRSRRTARSRSSRRSTSVPSTIRSTAASIATSRPVTAAAGTRSGRLYLPRRDARRHAGPGKTESISNGVRIRIGDPDKYVEVGEHRYVIRYSTTRQIGRFNGFDELYWNATGNGWTFPIDVAEARIRCLRPSGSGNAPPTPAHMAPLRVQRAGRR